MKDNYDVIVAGSGLGGLTAANRLACAGFRVLLAEQHFQFGGLATYFPRRGHVFDVALHGFPIGMQKSLRKYWGREFAERIIQVKRICFDNPQFTLETTFDTADFSRLLREHFKAPQAQVDAFFAMLKDMNYYQDDGRCTRQLLNEFFPGRPDIWRLLMEPITYANGSTLDEPAMTYAIVFGNFMSKGVYTFLGGTDAMLDMMLCELRNNGVDCEPSTKVEKLIIEGGRVRGAMVNGRTVTARAVVSNGNLMSTVLELAGAEHFSPEYLDGFKKIRLSNSSAQVYMGIRPGEKLDDIGDLLFTSTHPEFDPVAICGPTPTSRTYSVYYPSIRPGSDQYTIVASMNARHEDWAGLDPAAYRERKKWLIEDTLNAVERYVPGIRRKVDHLEAATPKTFARYTLHPRGASFGTKFEGLKYSMELGDRLPGLFHTGSVGIIMSGWLGAANYGVITANAAAKYLGA